MLPLLSQVFALFVVLLESCEQIEFMQGKMKCYLHIIFCFYSFVLRVNDNT